ncbi:MULTISPECIES: hypothetical protein [unclassified Paenibacillus]|uniref:hypothetical protein n=1 Tax=unclassified Paenibacillus TaxID=185978 RepID=UPI00363EEF28
MFFEAYAYESQVYAYAVSILWMFEIALTKKAFYESQEYPYAVSILWMLEITLTKKAFYESPQEGPS